MGLLPVHECAWVINAIELALEKLKLRKFDGSANIAFLQTYYAEMNKQAPGSHPKQ